MIVSGTHSSQLAYERGLCKADNCDFIAQLNPFNSYKNGWDELMRQGYAIGDINGWATSSGTIMIPRPAFRAYGNDIDYISCTIAHEIAHVRLNHIFKQSYHENHDLKEMNKKDKNLASLKRSRELELEADREAATMLAKAGYRGRICLKDIDFIIPKGKTFALVGESGSGKSTISDLLPRFYDVTEGSIFYDSIDIKNASIQDLRNHIGIVSQESILFNDTARNNILFGTENASEEEVIAAAKIANAHEFIMSLEKGYDTNIGERGNKLSGGQKQRMSIARAVLKNPAIMILDEATSALDTESEKLVQDALEKLMKDRTSLVIAHRLSTIRNADQIIVLSKGEIKEMGTHIELIEKKGLYYNLCSLQGIEN